MNEHCTKRSELRKFSEYFMLEMLSNGVQGHYPSLSLSVSHLALTYDCVQCLSSKNNPRFSLLHCLRLDFVLIPTSHLDRGLILLWFTIQQPLQVFSPLPSIPSKPILITRTILPFQTTHSFNPNHRHRRLYSVPPHRAGVEIRRSRPTQKSLVLPTPQPSTASPLDLAP